MTKTRSTLLIVAAVVSGACGRVTPIAAAPETYEYRIEHPKYGEIGRYTNVVCKTGEDTEVDSELHVIVKILGIVVYREEARRSERWREDKLVSFQSETITNGNELEVRGEARDGSFVIDAPSGRIRAPIDVHPSNPWSKIVLNANVVMSTKTGRISSVLVKGGDEQAITFDGHPMRLRQYEIVGEKRQFVWFDDRGSPVAFRTEQQGANVDFVLVSHR